MAALFSSCISVRMNAFLRLMKILAAGKTSSERAALSIARELDLDMGGQCRKKQNYWEAVGLNTTEAQATISLTRSRYPTPRTMRLILQAESYAFGFAIMRNEKTIDYIREWFRRDGVTIVHVTGHVPFSQSKVFLRAVFKTRRGL
jgi:hypothetical protein